MDISILDFIILLVSSGLTAFAVNLFFKSSKGINIEKIKENSQKSITESEERANEILSETEERVNKKREYLKQDVQERKDHVEKVEESLKIKEENIEKREEKVKELKFYYEKEQEFLEKSENEVKEVEVQCVNKLSEISGKTIEDQKNEILHKYREDLEKDASEKLAFIEENLKETAGKKAKKVLVTIMQRLSSPTSVETRSVQVLVPKDHIKGKILGKNGENIFRFEELLDVDVIFNDLPNTITISAFNLVNRRIAEKAMERLIKINGNITTKEIEDSVNKAKNETDEELYTIGRRAISKIGIKTEDKELIRVIGRLQYRTSFGQNIMKHSMEVAWISTMLGSELGLNVETCKIGGFLHDLGKAIDQNPDIQGAHDYLTKELMEKYGYSNEEIHAAWTHHNSEAPSTPEALIVQAADAVSACRPGARQESIDRYQEKIQALEELTSKIEGIKTSYAISAGREIRLIVDPDLISDENLKTMADSIAGNIEENLAYPGNIKVNVIRRTQYIEIAK